MIVGVSPKGCVYYFNGPSAACRYVSGDNSARSQVSESCYNSIHMSNGKPYPTRNTHEDGPLAGWSFFFYDVWMTYHPLDRILYCAADTDTRRLVDKIHYWQHSV